MLLRLGNRSEPDQQLIAKAEFSRTEAHGAVAGKSEGDVVAIDGLALPSEHLRKQWSIVAIVIVVGWYRRRAARSRVRSTRGEWASFS